MNCLPVLAGESATVLCELRVDDGSERVSKTDCIEMAWSGCNGGGLALAGPHPHRPQEGLEG